MTRRPTPDSIIGCIVDGSIGDAAGGGKLVYACYELRSHLDWVWAVSKLEETPVVDVPAYIGCHRLTRRDQQVEVSVKRYAAFSVSEAEFFTATRAAFADMSRFLQRLLSACSSDSRYDRRLLDQLSSLCPQSGRPRSPWRR